MSLLTVTQEGNGKHHCHADVSAYWILFYGLALLATGSFSPRSMQALGAGFFAFGILTFLPSVREWHSGHYEKAWQYPAAVLHMAFSFGVLHIIYAAAVWIESRRSASSNPPTGAGIVPGSVSIFVSSSTIFAGSLIRPTPTFRHASHPDSGPMNR